MEPRERDPLEVPPASLDAGGGGRRSAGIAFVMVTVLLAAGIGVAWQSDSRPTPTPPAHTPVAVATSTPAATPEPTPRSLPRPASAFTLAGLLPTVRKSSDLDGATILVPGRLESIALPCASDPAATATCVMLAVENVDLPVIAGSSVLPWSGGPPPGSVLVMTARRGGLVLLGWVVAESTLPSTMGGLAAAVERGDVTPSQGSLYTVDGYLVTDPVHTCPGTAGDASPCPTPPPFLADDPPLEGGVLRSSSGAAVALEPGLPTTALIPPASWETPGTFIVGWPSAAQCAAGRLPVACGQDPALPVVVARLDPGRDAWVELP